MASSIQVTLDSGTKLVLATKEVDYIVESKTTGKSTILMDNSTDRYQVQESVSDMIINGGDIFEINEKGTSAVYGIPKTAFSTIRESSDGTATIIMKNTSSIDTLDSYGDVVTASSDPSGVFTQGIWNYIVAVTDTDPAATNVGFNNLVSASITRINISNQSLNNGDFTVLLGRLKAGSYVYVQSLADVTAYVTLRVSGTVTDGTGWHWATVTVSSSGAGTFGGGDDTQVQIVI